MAQHYCYADSPDMSVPCADKGFTGMNAEDEWCCGSSLAMTDLVLPSVRYIRLAQHTESREQDMV